MSFRTRQAPSPTGYLHLGTARTVLFTKLFAMVNQGVWYLRLEDTDRKRLIPEAATNLIQTLEALGLQADEGVTLAKIGEKDEFYGVYQHGEYGPYIQSERQELYMQHAQNLIERKLAYWNYLSEEERQELQEIKQTTKRAINYFKVCSDKFDEQDLYRSVAEAMQDERRPGLMYKLMRDEKLKCEDELLGQTVFDLNLEEDFYILKSDGFPTYHLAHLIDDHLMQTTLAIRGQEWFASLPKHVAMFRDYWGPEHVIQYMHVPVILGESGTKKMSKRDGNVNMQDYLDQGYLPEAMVNYLAFLGWNPGTEKELYLEAEEFKLSLEQNIEPQVQSRLAILLNHLAQDFSLDKLSKSSARFNLEKLNWFNREYIKMMSLGEFVERAVEIKYKTSSTQINLKQLGPQEYLAYLLDKNRVTVLSELGSESDCILNYQTPAKDDLKWKKISLEESLANLSEIRQSVTLSLLQDPKTATLKNQLLNSVLTDQVEANFAQTVGFLEISIKSWLTENNKDVGSYLWPLRLALSGKTKSPSPFELLAILTPEQINQRIVDCLKQ